MINNRKDAEMENESRTVLNDKPNRGELNMKSYEVNPETVKIHPDAAIICEATCNELLQLDASISHHGQLEPAKMLNGFLLDGRARARVCERLKIPLIVEDLPSDTNAKTYVSTRNMVRRQMSLPQKAAVAALMTDYINRPTKEEKVRTVGKICNVPEKFINECLEVREFSEELFEDVHRGTINLNKALEQASAMQEEFDEKKKYSK